jgi:ketosteroid isomerase-like protein
VTTRPHATGMDLAGVARWMDGYVAAWSSNVPDEIRSLFTDDARYYVVPTAEPWVGPDEIAARWAEIADEPGTWTFRYEPLALAGDLGFVRARTVYDRDPPGSYENLFVIRFAADGRCAQFTEWYEKHESRPRTGERI